MDPKTVFGYYLSIFNILQGCVMYLVLCAASMGFFISLTFYVDAFSEDFRAIINGMNDETTFEDEKSSKSRTHKNDSFITLKQAILLHNDMHKYFCQFFTSWYTLNPQWFSHHFQYFQNYGEHSRLNESIFIQRIIELRYFACTFSFLSGSIYWSWFFTAIQFRLFDDNLSLLLHIFSFLWEFNCEFV